MCSPQNQAPPGCVHAPIHTHLLSCSWKTPLCLGAGTAEADGASRSWTGVCSGAAELLNAPGTAWSRRMPSWVPPALPWEVSVRALLCQAKPTPISSFWVLLELEPPSAMALTCVSKCHGAGELLGLRDPCGDPLPCSSPWHSRDPPTGRVRPNQVPREIPAAASHLGCPFSPPALGACKLRASSSSWAAFVPNTPLGRAQHPLPSPPAPLKAAGSGGTRHQAFRRVRRALPSLQLAGPCPFQPGIICNQFQARN